MKLDHLVILVRSFEDSLEWYSTMLGLIGFTKASDHVWGNEDGTYIDLREAKRATPGYERYAPGLNHLGFTAPDMKALDAVRQGMVNAGFEVPEIQRFETETATFFRDPEGMRVEVTVYD